MEPRVIIPKRVALEFKDNDVVNLGAGIPTLVPNYIPDNMTIWLHSENGFVGLGPKATEETKDPFFLDAGNKYATAKPGASSFDTATSFGIMRGGHLDATVLGTLQVDEKGNIANWNIPGGRMSGMGGAMDLVVGAKRVIVATEHTNKKGQAKILEQCTFPLTGLACVDRIITELAVIKVTKKGLLLLEVAPNISIEEVISKTKAKLIIPDNVITMPI